MHRRDGWWGLIFVVALFMLSAMGSLPTAAESGESIKAFYAANRQVIIIQQCVGVLLLVPFLGFAIALDRRAQARTGSGGGWILIAGYVLAAAELATRARVLMKQVEPLKVQ